MLKTKLALALNGNAEPRSFSIRKGELVVFGDLFWVAE